MIDAFLNCELSTEKNLSCALLPDLLYALSGLPRQLNFIEHTSDIGWKEYDNLNGFYFVFVNCIYSPGSFFVFF